MSDSDNEIFEIEDTKPKVEPKIKKEKTKLSEERLDKLREQLKTAREAKLKRKNGEAPKTEIKDNVEKSKASVKEVVIETPKKERKPRAIKEDKTELLLKEIQGLKLELGNMKSIAPSKQVEPVKENEPVKQFELPKQPLSQQQAFQKPVVQEPYRLFKVPVW